MIYATLLALHIGGGVAALITGPVAMSARKGGRLHRRGGLAFATAMMISALSAVPLAITASSVLLLAIGVLTAFLIVVGVRAIAFHRGHRPSNGDRACAAVASGFGVWLLWHGCRSYDGTSLFFGAGGCALAIQQWRRFSAARNDWIVTHLSAMGGAYVATVTAFLVVNVTFLPHIVMFITPTLLGTILIGIAVRHHGRGALRRASPQP